jgi:hypothetical protein
MGAHIFFVKMPLSMLNNRPLLKCAPRLPAQQPENFKILKRLIKSDKIQVHFLLPRARVT